MATAFFQDLRYALRMLGKSPGFTAVAVLTLALGMGANSAIFSVINGVLLKPLPYHEPQQLVTVWGRFTGIGLPNERNWFSVPEFHDLQELSRSLSGVAAMTDASFNITAGGIPERVEGAAVSPTLFTMLGINAVAGRVFLAEEAQPGQDQVILLGHGLWQRRFGSDPNVVGRTLVVNGRPMKVVGVLPAGFAYPLNAEMWQPLAFTAEDLNPNNRGNHGYLVLARIKPELTREQDRADKQGVNKTIIERNLNYPYRKFKFALVLVPLLEDTVGDAKTALWVLTGAVGFVLLIACVNVASLLLARVSEVRIDARVLFFTMGITLGTGILFGLAPALQASRRTPFEDLKEGGRSGTPSSASNRARRVLVVSEVAFSVILLVGAGLLMRSFLRVLGVDAGFHADRILTMRVSLPQEKYSKPEQVRTFYAEVLRRIGRLPGVEAAGAAAALPLSGLGGSGTTTVDTQDVPPDQTTPEADWRPVTPGYFQAMEIPLIRGRYFEEYDSETSAPVAIVDDTFARAYWPNEDPVGKRVKLGGRQSTAPWMTIAGVVGHVHYRALEAPSRVQLYWPEAQRPYNTMSLAVRTTREPLALGLAVEKEILAVDADQPVYQVRSMQQLKSEWVSQRFLALLLVALFADVALVLAAVGIYGVMAHSVALRTHEIGIRMTLGASRTDVLRMILAQGASLTAVGLGIGVLGAIALTRLMKSMLYSVRVTDPLTFLGVTLLLVSIALLACYIPARRATSVDPLVALRYE